MCECVSDCVFGCVCPVCVLVRVWELVRWFVCLYFVCVAMSLRKFACECLSLFVCFRLGVCLCVCACVCL